MSGKLTKREVDMELQCMSERLQCIHSLLVTTGSGIKPVVLYANPNKEQYNEWLAFAEKAVSLALDAINSPIDEIKPPPILPFNSRR
jgi:hypothetical protein